MDGAARGRGAVVASVTAAGLCVVALAASSRPGPAVELPPAPTAGPLTPPPAPEFSPTPLALPTGAAQPELVRALSLTVLWVLVVLALALLAYLGWLARRAVLRRRPPPLMVPPGQGPLGGIEVADVDAEAVGDTLAASIARLRSGVSVDEAIVACWRSLEALAGESGATRRPTDTAEEYTVAVLTATAADPRDLEELADLYRRALFAGRPPTEGDRDRAVACLERLVAALAPGGVR